MADLTVKYNKYHQSTMVLATVSKAIRFWIQNLQTNWLCFHFFWLHLVWIKMIFLLKTILISKHYSKLIPVTCQNFKKFLNKISGDKTMVLTMLSLWQQSMMLCKFWFWLQNVFETVAETMGDWMEWKFQRLYKKY